MLSVLLMILKIIGWTLLIVLGIILLLLLLVLFAPIRYKANGSYEPSKNDPETSVFLGSFFVKWFLPFSYVSGKYENGLFYHGKIFGHILFTNYKDELHIIDERAEKKARKEKIREEKEAKKLQKEASRNAEKAEKELKKAEKNSQDTEKIVESDMNFQSTEETIETEKNLQNTNETIETGMDSQNIDEIIESGMDSQNIDETIESDMASDYHFSTANEFEDSLESNDRIEKPKKDGIFHKFHLFQKLKDFFHRVKCTFLSICGKIKKILGSIEYYLNLWEKKATQKEIQICKDRLLKLLKHIMPRKWKFYLHAGFEDPSTTGKLMGFFGMLIPVFGNHICVLPDFENVVLEGNFYIKGHICVFKVLVIAGQFYFDKNLKKLMRLVKKGGK